MQKIFHYYPVLIKNKQTGKDMRGFKFPANGVEYDDTNDADKENLQQFYLYFGINNVISSIHDLINLGSDRTNKLYIKLLKNLTADYEKYCICLLELASSMCWIPTDDGGYTPKFNVDRALEEIEIPIKSLILAIQTKMDLLFPAKLVAGIARLEIEKDLLDVKEVTEPLKNIKKKK